MMMTLRLSVALVLPIAVCQHLVSKATTDPALTENFKWFGTARARSQRQPAAHGRLRLHREDSLTCWFTSVNRWLSFVLNRSPPRAVLGSARTLWEPGTWAATMASSSREVAAD